MTTGFAVTAGWDLPVADASHVHAAVAMAEGAAWRAGLVPADRASCALIATELATNLARHARDGRLVATATEPGPAAWVQLAAVDHGPGIPDVEAAMADGYSTYPAAGSLGGGLGACRRAAAVFDLWTSSGPTRPTATTGLARTNAGTSAAGTAVIARVGPGAHLSPGVFPGPGAYPVPGTHPSPGAHPSPCPGTTSSSSHTGTTSPIRIGGILSARPGEQESGDAWGVTWDAATITVVIMDGLGHGPEAAEAAVNGLHEVAAAQADDPVTLLGRLDRRLLGGRGAVAAVARLGRDQLAFGGVGNIGARLGPDGRTHGLVSSMGTLGLGQRLRPQATVTPWRADSLFTAHTDGVRPSWDLSRYPGLTGHDPAVMAALIWRDAATRGDDSAVVVATGVSQPAPPSEPASASQPAASPAGSRP
jgi:anti-sigma regulatory factor (Ser/Thr protein kinase)